MAAFHVLLPLFMLAFVLHTRSSAERLYCSLNPCSYNGICDASYNTTCCTACSCPSSFHAADAQDPTQGCVRDTPFTPCSNNSYFYLTISSVVWKSEQHIAILLNLTDEACKQACDQNCSCIAVESKWSATYKHTRQCSLRSSLQLVRGFTSSSSFVYYIKIANTSSAPSASHGLPKKVALGLTVGLGLLGLLVALSLVVVYGKKRGYRLLSKSRGMVLRVRTPLAFSYKEMRRATNDFSEELGKGGFGKVYKGTLKLANSAAPNSKRVSKQPANADDPDKPVLEVAVKRLEREFQHSDKQFMNEVSLLGSIHHVNLVQLHGYCIQGTHKLLVYAFMKNGSLEKALFSADPRTVLDWHTRFNIALGSARGIHYLHEECQPPILHCDIKPDNILLDDMWGAKVSDFGLAKLLMQATSTISKTTTQPRGTPGYMAPEWAPDHAITAKVDVYSFGVVLFELMSGRRNLDLAVPNSSQYVFATWAIQKFESGHVVEVLDPRLDLANVDLTQALLVFRIALLCVSPDPDARPSMAEVVRALEAGRLNGPNNMEGSIQTTNSPSSQPSIDIHHL